MKLKRLIASTFLPRQAGSHAGKAVAVIALAASIQLAAPGAQEANPARDELQELRRKVQELERKLTTLESQLAGQNARTNHQRIESLGQGNEGREGDRAPARDGSEAKTNNLPTIRLGEEGFSLASGDGRFGFQLKGLLQVDSRSFFNDSGTVGNDGFLLRRARPVFQGTLFGDFDFQFTPDFGGSGSPQIFDAFVNYRYSQALQVQLGKFKVPLGLEQLVSDKDVFFNERALPTDLVPGRDVGLNVHGDLLNAVIGYAVGIYNGVGDGRNSVNVDIDDNKCFAGRLFFQPFKSTSLTALRKLGIGAAGSFEETQGSNIAALPNNNGFMTAGQQRFFAYNPTNGLVVPRGEHWRLSPQASYFYGPFSLLGEYVISEQRVGLAEPGAAGSTALENTAWQVAAGWVLTGEEASTGGVVPRHPFNPRQGNWGAWQFVARYSRLDPDAAAFPLYSDPATSARSASEWSVGLNWYLNRNLRAMASFSHTEFEGGGGGGALASAKVTRNDENVLFTRVQLAF